MFVSMIAVPGCQSKSLFVGSSVPISSLAFVFLMVAILTGVRLDLEVVLICIFLMPKDTEHLGLERWLNS